MSLPMGRAKAARGLLAVFMCSMAARVAVAQRCTDAIGEVNCARHLSVYVRTGGCEHVPARDEVNAHVQGAKLSYYCNKTCKVCVPSAINCSAGTYRQYNGPGARSIAASMDQCIACPPARFSPTVGAVSVKACAACGLGNETGGAAQRSTCQACAAGMFDHDSNSSTPCTTCGNGTSSGTGATVCFACEAGTWASLDGYEVSGNASIDGIYRAAPQTTNGHPYYKKGTSNTARVLYWQPHSGGRWIIADGVGRGFHAVEPNGSSPTFQPPIASGWLVWSNASHVAWVPGAISGETCNLPIIGF